MMTPREVVRRALSFQKPDRLGHDFPAPFDSDIAYVSMNGSPDDRPHNGNGIDEWGAEWENIGVCWLGEVKRVPLACWDDFDKLPIPDITLERRWEPLREARRQAGEKFLIGSGISIYERAHFIRGMENIWMDIHDEPEKLCRLLDILVEMNLYAIRRYGQAGVDGYFFCDDWGLQDRLMIDPGKWREIWKPRYARIFSAAHQAGMFTFLHSCGYIVEILDDLIGIGLDAVHMDQQENMGLELLGRRFGGRITFFCPVDIQTAMHRPIEQVRAYAGQMVQHLARPEGGLIAKWYLDPKGAGHTQEAIHAMCEGFLAAGEKLYGRPRAVALSI